MSYSEINTPLISVNYPGDVQNVNKMLKTLGGIKTISSTFAEKNRRLELRFRPDDNFCKPAFATRRPVVAVILKVKYKKKKNDKEVIVLCEPVGCVKEEYKFCNLCDFQYLPTTKEKCIIDMVVPKGLDLDWLNSDASYFLPPPAFSRMDSVQNFNFSQAPCEDNKPNVIGHLKRKRYGCTKCLTFDNPEVPTIPKNVPSGGICSTKIITSETLQHLKSLFQERPIYSKCAIRCISKVPLIQLKCLLPCVAYYFTNGPWRSLWVKFGYDPRKDPKSRMYQTLDYRVKRNLSKDDIKIKRSTAGACLSHKFSNQGVKGISVITRNSNENSNGKEEKSDDMDYIFKAGVIPPSRQCHYQYCDVHVPEIQSMLENLDDVEEDAVCHEVDGWLPPSMADNCREIMNKYVLEEINRRNKLSNQTVNSLIGENHVSSSGSESDFSDSEQF